MKTETQQSDNTSILLCYYFKMRKIVVIAHDIRSIHNIGSLVRTSEGMGVEKLYITGFSPYPRLEKDDRLPHIVTKIQKNLDKTSLGADKSLSWEYHPDVVRLLAELKNEGYTICALEQTASALSLPTYAPSDKVAILLGREVEGIDESLIAKSDIQVVIPMFGKKESYNVVQAAAIALYHTRFYDSYV